MFQPLQNILPGAITADFFQQAIRQAQEATNGNEVRSNYTKNKETPHRVHAEFIAVIISSYFLMVHLYCRSRNIRYFRWHFKSTNLNP